MNSSTSSNCPALDELRGPPLVVRAREGVLHALIPLTRAYVRYGAPPSVRARVWASLVEPHLAQHSHRFTCRTRFRSRMSGDTLEFVDQRLYYFGLYEPNLTRWLSGRLARGDTFVDVGANVGYFSLLAATLVGREGTVVAIEASPSIYERLRGNVSLNGLANVRAVNVAAHRAHGRVALFAGPPIQPELTTLVSDLGFELEANVAAAPLDSILAADELASARLVKVDVEGAEWAVVEGMAGLLARGRDDLEVVIELHPHLLERQGKRVDDVFEPFLRAGFLPYTLPLDYSAPAHLSPPRRVFATRLREAFDEHADVVFSRRDLARL